MFSILLSIALLGQINTSGLTDEQEAELRMQAARMKTQNQSIDKSLPTAEKLKQYAEFGQAVGVAFSSTAKELGVAVDDFSKTNVGKLTIALIIWKIAGRDFVHFIAGSCFFLIMTILWARYFRRMCLIEKLTYHDNGKLKEKVFTKPGEVDGTRIFMFLALAVIVAVSCIILFT